jgi:hypothetical protein
MAPASIPLVKERLRTITLAEAQATARKALMLPPEPDTSIG